jgi:endonuclease/exonuclease/phosphatase family metal-dependent hydrolase
MRYTAFVIFYVIPLAFATVPAKAEELRVMTYNIHHAEGTDKKLDLKRIAKVIRAESPDLVAIQEVDQGTQRSKRIDEPAELSKLTDMHVVFQKNIDHDGGGYGNVVLSKLPIKSHKDLKLPSLAEPEPVKQREQRGMLVVEVQSRSGDSILFACTHLDCRRQDQERFESARVINDWFRKEYPQVPAILAGDLNDTPESRVLSRFAEFWRSARAEEMPTVPVSTPRRQIDYILLRPAARWRAAEVRVIEERVASDHRPYSAILELLPPK